MGTTRGLLIAALCAPALLAPLARGGDDKGASATVLPLTAARLDDPTRLPPARMPAVTGALPPALSFGDSASHVADDGTLEFTRAGSRRADLRLAPGSARLLVDRLDDAERARLVFDDGGAWRVCGAALLRGGSGDGIVELLDVDCDGKFDGQGDLIRGGDGPFRRRADTATLWLAGAIHTFTVVADERRPHIDLTRDPEPDWASDGERDAWRALNSWRNRFGLPPQRLGREAVEGCRLHHAYWALNGFTGHEETPGIPGYSEAGAHAASISTVGTKRSAAGLVDEAVCMILHRQPFLGRATEEIGTADGERGSLFHGGRLLSIAPRTSVLIPGPGERLVPEGVLPERPVPERDPSFYATKRGFPVGVYFPGNSEPLRDVSLTVTPYGADRPLAGDVFHDGALCHSSFRRREVVFVADAPLAARTWYRAQLTAKDEDGPLTVSWWFTTGDRPFPGLKKR